MNTRRLAGALIIPILAFTASCSDKDPVEPILSGEIVDLFPVPVSDNTSLFPAVDDSYLYVPFTLEFSFPFYGVTYNGVYLNTNGGLTFGSGNYYYDEAAEDIPQPGIGVFWGDMDAEEYSGVNRPNQMRYQQHSNRFVVMYQNFQDNDDADWNNTATLTMYKDGRIEIAYGVVLSADILVGIWNGTHTGDFVVTNKETRSFANYPSLGTGVLLVDYWGDGVEYNGFLDNQTLTFLPN